MSFLYTFGEKFSKSNVMNKPTKKLKKLSYAVLVLTTLFPIGFLTLEGCNKQKAQPKVSDFFASECNDIVPDNLRDDDYPYFDTIYVTTIDDTKLKISTTNTPFYCGTDTIRPEIDTQEQSISIALLYKDPWSDCICGHHVGIVLDNLTIGETYTINLKRNDSDYFQFEVAFGQDTNLMFVIEN